MTTPADRESVRLRPLGLVVGLAGVFAGAWAMPATHHAQTGISESTMMLSSTIICITSVWQPHPEWVRLEIADRGSGLQRRRGADLPGVRAQREGCR